MSPFSIIPPNPIHSDQKFLLFTITNIGYAPFVKSFIKRLKQIKFLDIFYIVCTDEESYNLLSAIEDVKCILWNCNITKQFVGWKNKNYTELVFVKFDITKFMLEYAKREHIQYVLYTDCDIWFFKNFKQDLLTYADSCINTSLFMQDGEDYRLDPVAVVLDSTNFEITKNRDYKRLCTGFMLIKPNLETINLFDYKSCTEVSWTKFVGNQPYLNAVLIAKKINAIGLPREKGINGSSFFINDGDLSYESLYKKDPWFVHYTYLIHEDKLIKMKEHQHWYE